MDSLNINKKILLEVKISALMKYKKVNAIHVTGRGGP
jgi:hypothetical protein